MRQYGKQRTRTRVSGHQDCATCHPETPTRTGRVRARREAQPLAEYIGESAPVTVEDELAVEFDGCLTHRLAADARRQRNG